MKKSSNCSIINFTKCKQSCNAIIWQVFLKLSGSKKSRIFLSRPLCIVAGHYRVRTMVISIAFKLEWFLFSSYHASIHFIFRVYWTSSSFQRPATQRVKCFTSKWRGIITDTLPRSQPAMLALVSHICSAIKRIVYD